MTGRVLFDLYVQNCFIMFTRVSPLILYLQAAVFLVLVNYYLNPALLRPYCVAAKVDLTTLGHDNLIDCSACLIQDGRDLLESRLSGDIDVLLPLNLPANGINGRLSVESKLADGLLQEKLMFLGSVYQQKGCNNYECNQWLDPQDFSIKNEEKRKKLTEIGLQEMKGVEFREASIFKELVGAKPQEGSYRRISASVSGKNISSLMVRFRYNPVGDLNQEGQPFFLLHEIPDNLLVRLLLVGPIIFSILRLHSFLSFHKILLPSLLALSLCLAFFTEHLAVLGSSIAIYIIGAGILEQKNGALVMGLIFITGAILGETVVPSHSALLSCLVLVGILGWVLISWKTNHTRPELGQILVVSGFHLLVGGIYNWNFLLSVCPINLLVGLLWLHHQHHEGHQPPAKQTYSNLHFNQIEEEEDVLVKIDKALQKN